VNESTQKQLLEVLRETPRARATAAKRASTIGIRVSPAGYFALAALLTFVAVILLRTQKDLAALTLVTATWLLTPILVATDRLYFDGETLFRSGLLPLVSRLLRVRRPQLSVATDIESVEVATVRTLRRGGSVRYRYSVEVSGRGQSFVFASGGKKFRKMAQALLPLVADQKLDARATELRDYLCDAKELNEQLAELEIATDAVLGAMDERARRHLERRVEKVLSTSTEDEGREKPLAQVANRLRVAGRLRESGEAFRRALHFTPRDPWLLYQYARLLRSQASAFGNAHLLSRACAALKLSSLRGSEDARLLERVGESFFEFGQPARAAKTLRRALDLDRSSFRASTGLAEIALSEGKLAHVIHHYRDASRAAPDAASARLVRREADYYARLNDDDDYLSAELRRMNWLEGAGRIQQFAARVSFAALFVALAGSFLDEIVASVGWAVASSSIIGWSGSLLLRKLLARRRGMESA
jgi:tetratricopeptide (TPR) repeat protein